MIEVIKERREAVAEHCRRLNVRWLDVFGSAANGNFDEAKSDIDFLVEFENLDSSGILGRYLDLAESLEEVFDRKVDLVIAQHFRNPYFRASVESTKEPIYAT